MGQKYTQSLYYANDHFAPNVSPRFEVALDTLEITWDKTPFEGENEPFKVIF
jgi:hypothetical protein